MPITASSMEAIRCFKILPCEEGTETTNQRMLAALQGSFKILPCEEGTETFNRLIQPPKNGAVSKFFPAKRELKRGNAKGYGTWLFVSKFFPAKRELKLAWHSCCAPQVPCFKILPCEEGTETKIFLRQPVGQPEFQNSSLRRGN